MLRHFGERLPPDSDDAAHDREGAYDYLLLAHSPDPRAALEFIELDDRGKPRFNDAEDLRERMIRATLATYLKALEHFAAFCGSEQ